MINYRIEKLGEPSKLSAFIAKRSLTLFLYIIILHSNRNIIHLMKLNDIFSVSTSYIIKLIPNQLDWLKYCNLVYEMQNYGKT